MSDSSSSTAPRRAVTLSQIVERFGGELLGEGEVRVDQVATLESATGGQISFFVNPRYRRQLEQTQAAAVIVKREAVGLIERPLIVCDNPYAYFGRVSDFLNPPEAVIPGVHPTAAIDADAQVHAGACIGPLASVAAGAVIGERTLLGPGSHVGARARIGADCRIHANVSIYHDCSVGARAILHSGAVIGADGFGVAMHGGRWLKIPQIGRVIVGDDVEVGANTTIDRGALDDTVIEDGVKLDNQIQIGHNCRIGAHTAIAGCVGIAGSTRIGRYCRIGGGAMIGGHLEIADGVEIGAATAVGKSISRPGTYSGALPMSPHPEWLKNAAHIRHLDRMAHRIRELESRLADLERKQR
ncbi:MAG TPA: UDP-3-O-(3-hydroxymyristoyl)glucosamine N-acyltransferase [Burkholderiales bacterium]|nr:UDP-3-O-(3-hydroxymyristoyl)glucosamine N-acyltransferase [Burkholderiales bacterium]